MAKGGPMATPDILAQVDLPDGVNKKLAEFSLDLALQEDKRFDEVGSAGQVAWFLKRMEPDDVQRTPLFLRYNPIEFSTDELNDQMKALEQRLDDELTPGLTQGDFSDEEANVTLIFPHWRSVCRRC